MPRKSSDLLWTATLAVALILCLTGTAPGIAQEGDPEVKIEIELGTPEWDGVKRVLTLHGRTNLPEKTVLTCQIKLAGVAGPRSQTLVEKGGKISFAFPPLNKKQVIISAVYQFEVTCNPADQPEKLRAELEKLGPATAVAEAPVGEPVEQTQFREKVLTNLKTIFTTLRQLFMTTETHASFTTARIFNARRKAGGNIPESEARRIIEGWERYSEQHFEENMRGIWLTFHEHKETTFISPYADAERDIEKLLDHTRRWYAVSWVGIANMVEMEVPKAIKEESSFPKKVLLPEIAHASERVSKALGVTHEDWVQINAFRPEEGVTKGLHYMSKSSKFEISLPNEEWEFNTDLVHPQIRIRLTHKDDSKKNWGVVAVELRDYPECETPQDLDTAVEIDASERWPGYKKVKGGAVKVPDDQMEDGKRPGFYLNFVATAQDKKVFRVVDYALYCRWFKRTYSVIMIADEEHYELFEKEFEKIKQSFKVLDKE